MRFWLVSSSCPHPINGDETEICVFTKDPQKTWKEKLEGVTGVAKVFQSSD
jgi:hypothetical protein